MQNALREVLEVVCEPMFYEASYGFSRRHRHLPIKTQHAALTWKLNGHLNYFSVNGIVERVCALLYYARRRWHRWLRRRSQRTRMTWARFNELLKVFPLPRPTVRVQLWV